MLFVFNLSLLIYSNSIHAHVKHLLKHIPEPSLGSHKRLPLSASKMSSASFKLFVNGCFSGRAFLWEWKLKVSPLSLLHWFHWWGATNQMLMVFQGIVQLKSFIFYWSSTDEFKCRSQRCLSRAADGAWAPSNRSSTQQQETKVKQLLKTGSYAWRDIINTF